MGERTGRTGVLLVWATWCGRADALHRRPVGERADILHGRAVGERADTLHGRAVGERADTLHGRAGALVGKKNAVQQRAEVGAGGRGLNLERPISFIKFMTALRLG